MTYQKIKDKCLNYKAIDPIELFNEIVKDDISMHGPIHHFIDGACIITCIYNKCHDFNLDEALDELYERSLKMPGATCGLWGACGSSLSIGAALSIIHKTGPLSNDEYYKDNMEYTSRALAKIAMIGGPRCCKRNAYISILQAINFLDEKYNIILKRDRVKCSYSCLNKECIKEGCPFYVDN